MQLLNELSVLIFTMKAAVFQRFGSSQVIEVKQVPKPVPKSNELLVKVKATSVNSGDVKIRSKNVAWFYKPPIALMFGFSKPKYPILGTSLSGIVEQVGEDVKNFKVGNEIFGSLGINFGTHAEYITVAQSLPILHKPEKMSFEEAAAIPFGGQTALYFLRKAQLQQGKKVLVYGASGSVGSAAVQIAKAYGCDVYGASTKTSLIQSLGAKPIDYRNQHFNEKGPFDIIFETVGESYFSDCINSLNMNGSLLLISVNSLNWYFRSIWKNISGNKKVVVGVVEETKEILQQLINLYEKGLFKPVIGQVYPFDQIREAHRQAETGHKIGNIVITL